MYNKEFYFNTFGAGIEEMRKVLASACEGGVEYADLYFEDTMYRDLLLRDGEVSSGGMHTDFGVGIRSICSDHTGYSYCETTQMQDMLRSARAAASIAKVSGSTCVLPFLGSRAEGGDYYPFKKRWAEMDTAAAISFLKEIDRQLRQMDSRIIKIIARVSSSESSVMMFNSLDQLACDFRPVGSVTVTAVFSDGKVTDNRSCSRSFRMGSEMLSRALALQIASELTEGIDASLEAGRPKGGRMSVVMGAGASGILLHEAMGHAFEADFNRKGQSIFSDKMGKRVCAKGIDIIDDGTAPANRGACNWDDEGIPGQKTYMVRDGILTSYLHDRISARYYGVEPTGNGRRESFRFMPIPRMRLTYMDSGDSKPEDIIASVSKGIYVDEFSNGQVNIGEGDFTFYVKRGFLIENGSLTRPVKDVNIIGNGPRALRDIIAVGSDLKIDNGSWTCGKEQNVDVGCGMPTVLVKELTVGGE